MRHWPSRFHQDPKREVKTMGTAVRLFEAMNRATGRAVVLKEHLPIMKDLAQKEME